MDVDHNYGDRCELHNDSDDTKDESIADADSSVTPRKDTNNVTSRYDTNDMTPRYDLTENDDFDREEIATYEEVVIFYLIF